ncbi:uroporphyrinogen-III synthase [Paracoccus sp. R86501]|uniref:uroporphyrinogen-III synthase n=1 Tax=Paracoccus sp. R86501 TaxID=3101711 RepID=UPI00366A7AE4
MPADPRPTLLLTRPRPGAQRFAKLMQGWRCVISPVLRIVPVDHDGDILTAAQGLVFTSAHAVPAAGPGRGRPALCVGAQTARQARDAGFDVTEGAGTADSLLPLIKGASVPLVHPHGRHLAQMLPVPGVVVYDQQAVDLTGKAQRLLVDDAPVILPIFSPRTATVVAQQVVDARAPLWVVAISDAALRNWSGPAQHTIVADRPDAHAMRDAILRLWAAEQS